MARLPTFNIDIAPESPRAQMVSDGSAELWGQVASTATRFAGRIGDMADAAAKREGALAGSAAGAAVAMPSISYALGDGETGSYLDLMTQVESAGDPNARNQNSTATGLHQFTEGTWLGVVNRHRPDLLTGRSREQVLALRTDPAISRELAGALSRENGAFLKSRGLGVSNTSLYLAHFLGAGGAAKVLGADPAAPVAGLLGADQIAANTSVLEGKTAAQVIAWAGGKMGGAMPELTASVNGTIGGVDLTGAMTIRGQAFDGAALDIYQQRADMSLRSGMAAIALNHQGQPAELQVALDAFVAGQLEDVPELVRPYLQTSAERQGLALVNEAAKDWHRDLAQQNAAVFQDSLATRETDLSRLALSLPFDEKGDAALAAELDAFDTFIANSPLSPAEQGEMRRAMRSDVAVSRVLGGFNAQTDASGRARYAEQFDAAWKAGAIEGMDGKAYNSAMGTMAGQIKADGAEIGRQSAALSKQFDTVFDQIKSGWNVPRGQLAALRTQAMLLGDPAVMEQAGFVAAVADLQNAYRASTPAEVQGAIDELNIRLMRDGASARGLQTLDVLTGLQTKMNAELLRDPLGWAAQAGVVNVTPLDFSSPESTATSLAARQAEAMAVASHYGQAPTFFRPQEVTRLAQLGTVDPAFLPGFANGVISALGPNTPAALAEISPAAPMVAHVAGLVQASGRTELLAEMSEVIALRGNETYKPDLPKPARIGSVAGAQVQGALGLLPQTYAAALETATALYEGRAFSRGLTAEAFDKDDSPGVQLFNRALNEALGANYVKGEQYGGLVPVNGAMTLAPPGVLAEALPRALSQLAEQDLATQAAIGSANGVPVSVDQLRGGHLLAVGQGRYRVMLGDPLGLDPQPVITPDGRAWELDISALLKAQEDRGVRTQVDAMDWQDREAEFLYGNRGLMGAPQ